MTLTGKEEMKWTSPILQSLHKMKLSGTRSPRIIHLFSNLVTELRRRGDPEPYKYCLGSSKLIQSVDACLREF